MFTREELKKHCIDNLNRIGSYKPYTNAFKKGTITKYEGYGGYYLDPSYDDTLIECIKETEEQYGGMVYAVIHQYTDFGEIYTMLWASGYEEDYEYDVEDGDRGTYYVMAYVWNKSYEECSEFGSVGIKPAFGGLIRVA